jgi:SAM-dependent methyltransferase
LTPIEPLSSAAPDVFDSHAHDYEAVLDRGLAVSGEDSRFFARGRIGWLSDCLRTMGERPRSVLDYGCGKGSSAPIFFELLAAEKVIGIDASRPLLEQARQAFGSERASFLTPAEYRPAADVDLVYCNGVFHHIAPPDRPGAVAQFTRALKPGGLLALWENNPWSPATRYVMSRVPFDRDAILLFPGAARRMLSESGYEVLRTDFLFIFPRFLRGLRPVEPFLARLPLGCQYQVLCRKL